MQVATEVGTVLGTAGYMSPEQVRGKPADARSDIFSFGAVLYEMLSGKRAFLGDSNADTMSAILKEDPPNLSETNRNISPTSKGSFTIVSRRIRRRDFNPLKTWLSISRQSPISRLRRVVD
jgi:serine/threonine protein kinase